MFSFFRSKKPSPTQVPSDAIPGAIPAPLREDDFIFIERREHSPKGPQPAAVAADSAATSPGGSGLYPAIPGTASGTPGGAGGSATATATGQHSEEKFCHPLSGVPFELSSDLNQTTSTELTRIQVNDIMSFIGRTTYAPDYDFSLERSVLNE